MKCESKIRSDPYRLVRAGAFEDADRGGASQREPAHLPRGLRAITRGGAVLRPVGRCARPNELPAAQVLRVSGVW